MVPNMGEVRKGQMGGPLTLSGDMLVRFAGELKPDLIVPIHNEDYSHYYPVDLDNLPLNNQLRLQPGIWTDIAIKG